MIPKTSQPSGLDAPLPAAYDPAAGPDGLGVRTVGSDAASGALLDVLHVTADLGRPSTVEMAVRERATRFARAHLAGLASVVRIESPGDGRLEVWSHRAEGFRLSAVLEWTEARGVATPLNAALTVGDRLLAALASLQEADRAAGPSGHGAIAVDQVVVSESGGLTLTDYAFGTALSTLQWPRERLWRRFRIAMPPAAGLARFDHRVDVTQAAVVICALLAGRRLRADEYPAGLPAIVTDVVRRIADEAGRDDRDRLMTWLRSATEMEPRSAFKSAAVAREALNAALGHRTADDRAVRAWLREARGLVDEVPDAGPPAADAPVFRVEPPAPVSFRARLRRWLGIG
jgi:hypothetical protein